MYHSGNKLIDPELLFAKVGLAPGMQIAIFGCGRTGHIVFPAARVVGDNGLVYAIDIMKDILEVIAKRAALENFANVVTVWSDVEQVGKTAIPGASLDIVFLVNLLVRVKNREAVLAEAGRLLKTEASMVIVDWAKPGLAFAPPEDQFVNFPSVTDWAKNHQFSIKQEFSAGKYHRGMVLSHIA